MLCCFTVIIVAVNCSIECRIPMCSERCASSSVHLDQECQLLKKLELKVSMEDPEGHIIYCVSCILGVGYRLGVEQLYKLKVNIIVELLTDHEALSE